MVPQIEVPKRYKIGKFQGKSLRNRFFDISLASISETSAAIDIISAYGFITANNEIALVNLLTRAYAMIIKLKK